VTSALSAYTAYNIEDLLNYLLWLALLGVKLFAVIDALFRKDALFVAADKQNKAFWLLILCVFLALHVIIHSSLMLLNLIGTVIAFVYLLDVRPTLRSMHSR
jgi:Protein of unknown function (DUF2516)